MSRAQFTKEHNPVSLPEPLRMQTYAKHWLVRGASHLGLVETRSLVECSNFPGTTILASALNSNQCKIHHGLGSGPMRSRIRATTWSKREPNNHVPSPSPCEVNSGTICPRARGGSTLIDTEFRQSPRRAQNSKNVFCQLH